MLATWLIVVIAVVGGIIALLLLTKIITSCCIHKDNPYSLEFNGKVVIVTGGTSGIGIVTLEEIFLKGATVIFTGRNDKAAREEIIPRLRARLESTKARSGGSVASQPLNSPASDVAQLDEGTWDGKGNFSSTFLYFRKLDQSDLEDVKVFADWVSSKFQSVFQIINNAGAVYEQFKLTKQNVEFTMGVNHLSHYFLVELLYDKLAPEGRVVSVASVAHQQNDNVAGERTNWDEYFFPTKEKFGYWKAYCLSKLANVLFTDALALALRRDSKNAKATSLHPGVIRSNFFSRAGCFISTLTMIGYPIMWSFTKSVEQGAQTTLFCANAPYDKITSGEYYADCAPSNKSKRVSAANATSFLNESARIIEASTAHKIKHLRL